MKKAGKTDEVCLEIEGKFYKTHQIDFKNKEIIDTCSLCGVDNKCLELHKGCLAEKIKSFSSNEKLSFYNLKKMEEYEIAFLGDSIEEDI